MRCSSIRRLCLSLLGLLSATSLYSFTLSPMVAEIELGGSQPRITYTIHNDGATPIAVQVEVMQREIDVDGEESRSPAKELVAYPSQLVLGSGERRTVMVEWQGGNVTVEQPFRVIAEQVPVDFREVPETRARIRMNLRYVASLYVRPSGSAADPVVSEAALVYRSGDSESGQAPYAELLLENRGSSRLDLSHLSYLVASPGTDEGPSATVLGEESSAPSGVVLPGGIRRLYVPLPGEFRELEPNTPLTVAVEE